MKMKMEKSKKKKVKSKTLKVVTRKPLSRAAKVKSEPKKESKTLTKIKTEETDPKPIQVEQVKQEQGISCGLAYPTQGNLELEDEVYPLEDVIYDEVPLLLQAKVDGEAAEVHDGKDKDVVEVEVFQCSKCVFVATNESQLQSHFDDFHDVKGGGGKKVTKLITMRNNGKKYKISIKTLQTGEKKFICETCSKCYKTMNILRMHIKDAHILLSNFECNVCFKKFFTSSGLNHHVLADHLGVKNEHECTECGKRFDRQSSMKQHVSEVHLKERNFKCKICHKTYPRNSYLLRHVRSVHGGQKISHEDRISCDQCGNNFYNKWTLEKHVREVHLKLKKWKCEYCDEAFVRNNHLKKHVERRHVKNENA